MFHGSTGDTLLNGPDMAAAPGGGYWQLGSDGGVFAFAAATADELVAMWGGPVWRERR